MSEQSTAYKAGAAYARMKRKFSFQPRRIDPLSPLTFAVGGVAGFFAFSMLAAASELLASVGLFILIGALVWELMFKKP
jgi:hypothetical protein